MLACCLAACQVQENEVDDSLPVKEAQRKTVHFRSSPLETRTAFAEPSIEDGVASYPTYWTENDTEVAVSVNYSAAVGAEVQPSEDFTRADFDADFTDVEASSPFTFYVLSPASALEAVSLSRKALTIDVPSVQTPIATSADEAAQILFAKSDAAETLPEQVDVHFSHVTGYGRMTLKNLPEGVTVTSVSLTSSEQPWVGTWYYNTEDGTVEAKEASSTITIKTDASGDVWFACAPVDMKGKKLRISVATDAGTYEKEITLTSKNVDFTSGKVYKFSVNFSGIEPVKNSKVYRLVTDASALEAGKEVLIVNTAATYAAGSSSGNNRPAVSVTVTDGVIDGETLPSSVEVYTLEEGNTTGTWSFKNGNGYYLATTSSTSNNYLQTSTTTKNGYDSWHVTISTDGTAVVRAVSTVTSQGRTNYKHIRYNSNQSTNLLFSAYKSTSATSCSTQNTTAVAIYMEDYEGGARSDDPILDEEVFGAYLTTGNRVYEQGIHQLSREYSGTSVNFAILNPAGYSIYEFSGIPASAATGDSFTLTLNLITGRNASATDYNVTVVGESGAKLWLTDGAGNGFIVKR